MKKLAIAAGLVALVPFSMAVTATLVALDIAATLVDLKRGDRAGKWR
jgi:hypothetical protein